MTGPQVDGPGEPGDARTEYIVHIKSHSGWRTRTALGATFDEAAVSAVVADSIEHGLELDRLSHTAEYRINHMSDGDYASVVFRYGDEPWSVFGPFGWHIPDPGEFWFSERVEEGKPGDCGTCGGTGRDFYNPFKPCWNCGGGVL